MHSELSENMNYAFIIYIYKKNSALNILVSTVILRIRRFIENIDHTPIKNIHYKINLIMRIICTVFLHKPIKIYCYIR